MLDARDRRLLDVILATWTAIWILVGVLVWHEVRGLRPLAGTVAVAGRSLDDTAAALRGFASVPLVGSSLQRVADDATVTAVSAHRSAREGKHSVDRLAIILGIAVPAVAILPLGLAYSLLRLRR
ncbi:MAG TPA: hypothetical protein VI408_09985 [Gaiellaceae bacterium]